MARLARRLLLFAGICTAAAPAMADDLREALLQAYQTNPTLDAARASQRATDETVPIARAAGLPSLSGAASYTEFIKKSANNFTSPSRDFDANVNLNVPIYSGGAVRNRSVQPKPEWRLDRLICAVRNRHFSARWLLPTWM
jgi:outer membrane protein